MTFFGRDAELKILNQYYEREGSQILIVYGQKGIGKTTLLAAFGAGKDYVCYQARACSDREQRFQWAQDIRKMEREISDFPEYEEIFRILTRSESKEKGILVIDEFHNIVKNDLTFFPAVTGFLKESKKEMLVILCSSASGWVENSMIGRIGADSAAISGFLKVRELSAKKIREIYPSMSEDDVTQLYAVLGGNPGLWNCIDSSKDAAYNLIWNVLNKYSRIYSEMTMCLVEDLRETAVYNTILAMMSMGSCKLNDIYHHTEFSRAKISVYLKNLMELDFVDKIGAGVYRIVRPHIRFYFRFLFSNQGLLEELSPERFFKEIVEDAFPGFVREAYRKD